MKHRDTPGATWTHSVRPAALEGQRAEAMARRARSRRTVFDTNGLSCLFREVYRSREVRVVVYDTVCACTCDCVCGIAHADGGTRATPGPAHSRPDPRRHDPESVCVIAYADVCVIAHADERR